MIGQSPSEYVTGDEVEFTTDQSGRYVAGEDFPVGTYDIVAVAGSGNVMSDGGDAYLNEIMERIMMNTTSTHMITTHLLKVKY